MSQKSTEKLYLSKGKIIVAFLVGFIFFEALFYLTIQYSDAGVWFPLGTSFYIYTPVLAVFSLVFAFLAVTKTYYVCDKNSITHHRMNKEVEYSYKNIVYIDEEWSLKHKQLRFYDKMGNEHYLNFDKDGVIYKMATKYSSPLSKEEFRRKYPKAKL